MEEKILKVGIMGAKRGSSFSHTLKFMKNAEFTALCETDDKALEADIKADLNENVKIFKDFDEFLASGIDAVILCNYFNEHAKYAIKAFEAGIPVLSETTAAISLGECVQLVEACEKYNGKYMLAVNCMYFRSVHAMKERIDQGKTGKIMYAEAEYLHGGEPNNNPIDKNNLHWRKTLPPNMYNMHTLAPLMYVTGTEPVKVSCKMVRNDEYAKSRGKMTDCVGSVVITEMDNGATFNTTGCSGYHPTSKWYRIACENETMETARYDWREEKLVVASRADAMEVTYPSEITSGLVKEGDDIKQSDVEASGHGGIDYYTTYHFIQYALGKEEVYFDVYRSAALSAVGILGWYSALSDCREMPIPDFKDKAQRDKIRNDFRSPIGKVYDELDIPCRIDEKDKFIL